MISAVWNRAFAGGRQGQLAGEGPGRMAEACRRLLFDGSGTGVGVELPLLGPPSYDTLVILPTSKLRTGVRVRDPDQVQAQAMIDWLLARKDWRPSIFYELDAAGSGKLAGIHCRIEGSLDIADEFFRAAGEAHRIPAFRKAAARLPEGWVPLFAAVFPGRADDRTRMEVYILDGEAAGAMTDPAKIRKAFDRIGFTAYNGAMPEEMARLARVDNSVNLQFDLLPDGTFAPACSLITGYEQYRNDLKAKFAEDGPVSRICRIYEDMGTADGRWRLLEGACFVCETEGPEGMLLRTVPNSSKVKWKNGEPAPARFYLRMDAKKRSG